MSVYWTATTDSSSAETALTSGEKSQVTLVPPVTVQPVYVALACTTFALTVVAAALSVNATLSMFAGFDVLNVYATPETVYPVIAVAPWPALDPGTMFDAVKA
jgi:hypothetical protein